MALTIETTERLSWDSAIERMDWRPGEHVTLIGPTGRGKTEALVKLMEHRKWCVFLSTKRIDSTQDRLTAHGFRTIKEAASLNPEVASRYIFRPPFPRGANAARIKDEHREAFGDALIRLREQTGWTIGLDEARYVAHTLGLTDELELLWLQGRSEGTTVVANTQRPRFIPLEAYSQATHLFMWSSPDLSDVSRIGELASFNRERVLANLVRMPKHDILYVNTVTGDMFITNTRE